MKRALNWLTTPRIMAAVWLAMLAWIWTIIGILPGFSWAWLIVVACGFACLGLLFRQRWARWHAMGLLCIAASNYTFMLFASGWTFNRVLAGLTCAWLVWGLWKFPDRGSFEDDESDDEDKDDEASETTISLVLLRTSQRYMEPVILAHVLSDAWGLKIRAHKGNDPPKNPITPGYDGFVADTGPFYIAFVSKPRNTFFFIHTHEGNYFDDAETVAASVPNLRFADVIRSHQAWLSVEHLDKSGSPVVLARAYRFIGRTISALADDATLALLCPEHHLFTLWSDKLEEHLCGPEPLKAFRQEVKAPIIGVANDSGVEDAIAEARRRWPEFVKAFHTRKKQEEDGDDLPFIVKAPFTTGEHTEHMWLTVFALEPEYVHGHLANDPFYHPTLKQGSQVEIPIGEVTDWVFPSADGTPLGNFTARAVNQARRTGREQDQ